MAKPWTSLVVDEPQDPPAALATVRATLGAVHRLAWEGADAHNDRRRAVGWFKRALIVLTQENKPLATALDWWLVSAGLDKDSMGIAWDIERELPGPLGETLQQFLTLEGGLNLVRRPAAFAQVCEDLRRQTHNPGKKSVDKQHLQRAITECWEVLNAAKEGRPHPQDLRLVRSDVADLEAWASEPVGAHTLAPNSPIWKALVRNLTTRQELILQAFKHWPIPGQEAPELPAGWVEVLTEACGEGAELAIALVEDALPAPGARPLLALEPPERPTQRQALWFALTREHTSHTGAKLPPWAEAWQERIKALTDRLHSGLRAYEGEAREALEAAQESLRNLQLDEAETWLGEADREHSEASEGANQAHALARAERRSEQLAALGQPHPADQPGPWPEAVERAWRAAKDSLREAFNSLEQQARGLRGGAQLKEALAQGRAALSKGELSQAKSARVRAEEHLTELHQEAKTRLGTSLWAVFSRTFSLPRGQAEGLRLGVERAVARREAGLHTGPLVAELDRLSTALAQGQGAPTYRVEGVVIAFQWAGVATHTPHGVEPTPLPPHAWAELRGLLDTRPTPHVCFVEAFDRIEGPYHLQGGVWRPASPLGAVASLTKARFQRLFGRIEAPGAPTLVPLAPTLQELLQVGAQVRDLLQDSAVAQWLSQQTQQAPPPAAIVAWLEAQRAAPLPEALRAARLARLKELLPQAEALESARRQAVQLYLGTEAGAQAVAAAATRLVDQQAEGYQRTLAAKRLAIDQALAQAQQQLDTLSERVAAEERAARANLAELQQDLAAAEELLSDRKLRLLAELGGVSTPAPHREVPTAPFAPPPFIGQAPADMRTLVTQIAGQTWGELEVANLLLSLVTGRWTLLAGLPGVGKSTFVRSVLTRLGHGPGTPRYLELVVRRDWQDDAALFGFWHPTQHRWTASSEGFVEHLLRAANPQGAQGLWPVLVEELNLASPEYYLGRMLSAFEAANPTVRLYDAELSPPNAARYPPEVPVSEAVRMLATVNVDDTVERLSPRFLSRASVIWVEPKLDAPLWRPEQDHTGLQVPWAWLSDVANEEAELGPLLKLVRFLQEERVPGAPTARTRRAMARYLAAARGVIPASEAQDLQVLQRVLPPLRGVGPRWRRLLDKLVVLLQEHGWRRSAARTQELRERGEELGDWYDFFHT